ncbi:WbqC family protein [Crocinitomicaceae bacterium]|nr:WbqC family protein [Crocinitomicaceae bacterium]
MDRISCIFPTAYFPSIAYLKAYLQQGNPIIESFESFPKQTLRNRCEILTSNGVLRLSIPINKINGSKTFTKDIEVDYSKKWQNEHWRAIQSAYASAPYFDDYGFEIKKIIYKKPNKLIDFNTEILKFVMRVLDIKVNIKCSKSYEKAYHLDYRNTDFLSREQVDTYQQVFSYDKNFTTNLSFLDLLFNEGPFMRNWILKK